MKEIVLTLLVAGLLVTAGCQDVIGGGQSTPTETSAKATEGPTPTAAETTPTDTSTPTPTTVDERRRTHLEEFARAQERAFVEETNLTNVNVYREEGTANLTASFGLGGAAIETREARFENALEALVQSNYNWVVEGGEVYRPDYITVRTDYGNASASAELLQLYIDGKLDKETTAFVWAGKFDRFDELGEYHNASHDTRQERLAYTTRVFERRAENQLFVQDVETAVEDETIYIKFLSDNDPPNSAWPQENVTSAYYETVTKLGPTYIPSNGVRMYGYNADGSPDATWRMRNRWVVGEYVGLRPLGEASYRTLITLDSMDEPHDGPP